LSQIASISEQPELRKSTVVVLSAADQLLSNAATRYFVLRFLGITTILFFLATSLSMAFGTPVFRTALYIGMATPIAASFLSFLAMEWSMEQPLGIWLGVSLGTLVLRVCNLLFAFVVGLVIFKLNTAGLTIGLLVSYFSLLTVEIAYLNNKGSLRR
jgi:hypothetical protein